MNNIIKFKNPNICNLLYFTILDEIKIISNFLVLKFGSIHSPSELYSSNSS